MTLKRRRLIAVLAGLTMLGVATVLVLLAFNDNLVFFYSPSDLKTKHVAEGRLIRIGGLVAMGSVARDGTRIEFRITDGESTVPVTYSGVVPDLFREGQGVVVEGKLDGAGMVEADSVLAKHDEKYMPPVVQKSLKQGNT